MTANTKKWLIALAVFSVVYTLVRQTGMLTYYILPTTSMEPTYPEGKFIVVSNLTEPELQKAISVSLETKPLFRWYNPISGARWGAFVWTLDKRPVWDVAFHPTERRIASGSRDQTTRIWSEETGEMIATFEEGSPVIHVTWSPDGRRLASLLADGTIRIRTALTYPGF